MRHSSLRPLWGVAIAMIACLAGANWLLAAPVGSGNSEWQLLGNSHEQQFYSPLKQINDKTVSKLGLAWSTGIPTKDTPVGNPLVADGAIYQTSAGNRVFAHDLRTGKLLWVFDPYVNYKQGSFNTIYGSRISRGLALWEDKVIIATADCRIVAVDRKTGQKVWDSVSCDKAAGVTQTGAPRVGGGMVFMGDSCMDSGEQRGVVRAFDAKTGKLKWLWHTVPDEPSKGFENKAMQMAAKTWGTDWWKYTRGCGSVWEAITYDEKLNQLYIGPAGIFPFSPAQRAPDAGDELFTDSVVALNADTGEYVWHYKLTPNNGWDFEPFHIMVADLPINGKTRRVVMEAPKNGFFYVLDAKTGKFISANNYVPVTWASRIDPKTGRPVFLPEARWWEKPAGSGTILSPAASGAHGFQPMAFNPATGLVYIPAMISPELWVSDPSLPGGVSKIKEDYQDEKWKASGRLVAWDPVTQKARWEVKRDLPVNGGIISTGGNLVFQGTAMGLIEAHKADTGEKVWSVDIGAAVQAAPTTVELDGEQYLIVVAGNGASGAAGINVTPYTSCETCRRPATLLAFKLGGTAQMPKWDPLPPYPMPPLARFPMELATKGHELAEANGCEYCHGIDWVSAHGTPADLRRTGAERHRAFKAIVHDGILKDLGMPGFDQLSDDDLKALQAHLINTAWDAYALQEKNKALGKTE